MKDYEKLNDRLALPFTAKFGRISDFRDVKKDCAKNVSNCDPIFDLEVQSALLSHFGMNNDEFHQCAGDITNDVVIDCNQNQNIIINYDKYN